MAALALVGTLAGGGAGSTALVRLPPPALRVQGPLAALAAAGPRVALSTGCDVRVVNLVARSSPMRIPQFGACRSGDVAGVDALWLGRSQLVAEQLDAPSPHGEDYTLWAGPLPRGPLRSLAGEEWGWRDDEDPSGYGCVATVVVGGGLIARADGPNALGVDGLVRCTNGSPTVVRLIGGFRSSVVVPGSWTPLATDGKRLALAGLDAAGSRTGELALIGLDGTRLAAPRFAAAAVAHAGRGWLAGRTLILETPNGISGPGWTIRGAADGTLGEGRLLYRLGRVVRVRRLRDGTDRPLVRLPTSNTLLAAGSFGVAVATGIAGRTRLYRLTWRTIDRTLTR